MTRSSYYPVGQPTTGSRLQGTRGEDVGTAQLDDRLVVRVPKHVQVEGQTTVDLQEGAEGEAAGTPHSRGCAAQPRRQIARNLLSGPIKGLVAGSLPPTLQGPSRRRLASSPESPPPTAGSPHCRQGSATVVVLFLSNFVQCGKCVFIEGSRLRDWLPNRPNRLNRTEVEETAPSIKSIASTAASKDD